MSRRRVLARVGARALMLGLVVIGLPAFASPGQAATDGSFATLYWDRNDIFEGTDGNSLWQAPDQTFTVSATPASGIRFEAALSASSPPRQNTIFEFVPPVGQELHSGHTYENTADPADVTSGQAGLRVTHTGDTCPGQGTFTVRDVAPDLSRLWITYMEYCGDTWGAAARYGEIRYHEPDDDPNLTVTASQFTWPRTYVGDNIAGTDHEIFLVNRGSAAMHVGRPEILSGGSAFSVEDGCNWLNGIPPGSRCALKVDYRPTRVGVEAAILRIPDESALGHHDVALSGEGYAGHTSVLMTSDPSDVVGQGATIHLNDPPSSFWFEGPDWGWRGDVSLPHRRLEFDFGQPSTTDDPPPLQVGHVYATRRRSATSSTLPANVFVDIAYRNGDKCSHAYGAYRVDQATYSHGRMTSFALVFEQRCGSAYGPPLYGSLAWHAEQAPAPVPTHALDRSPSSIGVAVSRSRVLRGRSVVLSGGLEDRGSKRTLAGRYVRLESRRPGTTTWHYVGTTRTDRLGHYRFTQHPGVSKELRTRFVGDDIWSPGASALRRVTVTHR